MQEISMLHYIFPKMNWTCSVSKQFYVKKISFKINGRNPCRLYKPISTQQATHYSTKNINFLDTITKKLQLVVKANSVSKNELEKHPILKRVPISSVYSPSRKKWFQDDSLSLTSTHELGRNSRTSRLPVLERRALNEACGYRCFRFQNLKTEWNGTRRSVAHETTLRSIFL